MKLVTFSREVFHLDCVKDHTLSQKMFQEYADPFKDEVGDLPVTQRCRSRDNTGCQPSALYPSCNAKSGTRAPKNANSGSN